MVVNFTLDEMGRAVEQWQEAVGSKKVVAFHGEMGAGKTTFIQAIARHLGVLDAVSSPTFSIINEYQDNQGNPIYHLDLYRLRDSEEAVAAGVEDCFYSGAYCLVEWPERASSLLPADTVHCQLTVTGQQSRKLQIIL